MPDLPENAAGLPVQGTPIALIVFRRPDLAARVLEAVSKIKPNKLYVIADGPRAGNDGDKELVEQTRAIFEDLEWECDVVRIYSDSNLGLRERVLSGLDFVFSNEDRAIILEDDCVPSEQFFRFSTELLAKYAENKRVAMISANNFGVAKKKSNGYFFSAHAHIWGWATWARAWKEFRSESTDRYVGREGIQNVLSLIPTRAKRKSMRRMLDAEQSLDSWALNFSMYCYKSGKLSVVPEVNLATNIGFGEQSTHTKFESYADEVPVGKLNFPLEHPRETRADQYQMTIEALGKSIRWVVYPILHPWDFLGRVSRYFKMKQASRYRS